LTWKSDDNKGGNMTSRIIAAFATDEGQVG